MAGCKDCYHYEICAKQSRMVQIDEHTWDTYEEVLDGVEKLCEHFIADVVPKSEVEKIFEEIERFLYMHFRFCKEEIGNDDTEYVKGRLELNTQIQNFIAELKKKYTEGKT